MTTFYVCDYCGEAITGYFYVAVIAKGNEPSGSEYLDWTKVDRTLAHYHTKPPALGGQSCFQRVAATLDLLEQFGPSLEAIPTITGQAVAARRRKFHREEEGEG